MNDQFKFRNKIAKQAHVEQTEKKVENEDI